MITFAAFTPHSPLLIETIGKENGKYLSKTKEALHRLSNALTEAKPDVLFVISSHGVMHDQAFSINLHPEYIAEFKEFGDHTTHRTFSSDVELITQIQRATRTANIPFVLESLPVLDYGSGVPLLTLCKSSSQPKIVPISYSGLDRKQHLAFGRLLKDIAMNSQKRIGFLASGDLSHSLTSESPVGFRKEGQMFDDVVVRSVKQFSASTLLTLSEKTVERAAECGLRPLLILFGMLEHVSIQSEVHSYESPFGVGYLVAQFHLL